ncbi:MAG TPA: YbaB/EbfC family nucleoid-associated protein [Myxococcales bacterium LLY-WYZ-16_1]|jgi:hypothetical protein|nr:YbaB/EbfC family nucleoid-associated protein [Myxococcales bacterium LLY-WYZ-16_1]
MNIQEMMRQAQQMQKKLEKIKEEVGQKTVEGSAGGGMVTVRANGQGQVLAIEIDKEVVDPEEVEMLQDLIVAAVKQALDRANELMQEETSKLMGGMKLPGMF